jgi:AraC-like DNA-binding protein
VDVLTEILSSLKLNGGIVFDATMRGDWCAVSRYDTEHCAPYFPIPQQIISYHYVRKGHVYCELPSGVVIEGNAGTMILFPRNDEHLIYSKHGLEPQDLAEVTVAADDFSPSVIRYDGEGEETLLFCGWLGVLSDRHPLLESLPPVLVTTKESCQSDQWLTSSLSYAASALQDDPALVAKLSEVFFAQAVRRYIEELPTDQVGWLGGLKDPSVARALAFIHRNYADELDIEQIAEEAGLSRTVLGERFVELMGEPPMRYCARWRMRVAANMLRDGLQNNANVAYSVGFNSEAAFNRAFKREFGKPPASWKRDQLAAHTPAHPKVVQHA